MTITKDSPREDILDYIMIFLCERIDIKLSVFKGGYVLTKLMPDEARMTEGIDFSISEEHQYYDIIPVLEDLGNDLIRLGVITGYEVKPTIGERSSGGIHMMTPGNIPDLKLTLGGMIYHGVFQVGLALGLIASGLKSKECCPTRYQLSILERGLDVQRIFMTSIFLQITLMLVCQN